MLGPRFIGRYKVIEEIGRGGMGIVYRGEDPRLERPVAIKVLPPRKTSSTKALDRFKREARVCARLDHPYILKIFDYDQDDNTYFIVMEFVEGVTLREVIGEDPDPATIDLPEMSRLFGQICQAMDYAHSLQITHRDIKPENIMITTSAAGWGAGRGKVKVMDFGLAVLENHHSLTDMGAVMGTIAYLSPEQALGERADHRSDIYSMGAIFYEMLTGELPFMASNAAEMLSRHKESPAPSPRVVNPRVHPILERIVLTCMRKDPADRYQSVRAIREELEQYRAAAGIDGGFFWGSAAFAEQEAQKDRPDDGNVLRTEVPDEPVIERRRRDLGRDARDDEAEMRVWRESDEAYDPDAPSSFDSLRPPAPSLDIPPLASPYTPGMPPEIASRLGPKRTPPSLGALPRPGVPLPRPGAGHELGAPPPSDTVAEEGPKAPPPAAETPAVTRRETQAPPSPPPASRPTGGVNPIASREWMQEASEPQDPWGRYQQVVSRLQRDEVMSRDLEVPSTACNRCGAENPGDKKYCNECGSLLTPSYYQTAREAAAHNDKGLRLYRQGQLHEAIYEFQQALLLDSEMGEAHKNLGRVWAQLRDMVKAEEELKLARSLAPDDVETLVELADLYRQDGRKSDAIEALATAVRIRPSDTGVRCQLAFLYSHTGSLVRAVEEYKTVIAYDLENLDAHLQLGIIFGSQGLVQEAIQEFEWVIKIDPNHQRAWQWLGQLYTRRNKFHDAEKAYQNALSINPADADVHAELGSLYEVQRRDDLARKQLKQAIALDQGHVEAHTRLAALYLKYNQPGMAIEQLEAVLSFHPQDSALHQQLGELYMAAGQLDRALEHFEKTVSLDPTSTEMHRKLGQLYLKKDYAALAVQEYQRAVSLDPHNAGCHEDLGMAYYVHAQRDLAIQEMKKAAILDSRQLDYPKALGVMCEEEGRLDEAVQYLKRALEMAPRDPDAHGLLGRVYRKQKLTNLALLEFQKAIEYRPDNQLMYIYLANCYNELGKKDLAVDCFRQAIGLIRERGESPESRRALARSYQDLGRTYLEAGDVRAAQEVLESALALQPEDARGLHYMGRVLQEGKDFKKALDFMSRALMREPQSVEILGDLALLYDDLGDRDKAMMAVRKALSLAPNRVQLYEMLATILASKGDYDEAFKVLRSAFSMEPKRAGHLHFLQGNFLMEQRRWQQAAGEYQQAVAQNSWNWKFYQGLARALEEMGRYEEAATELEKALSLQVTERDARELRDDLDRVRSIRR